MYKILSVSRNTRLLLQRNDTLALAGFRVVSPRTPEQAPYLAYEQHVDAVIIGHSVEAHMRQTIIQMLKPLCPECVIVFVYTGPRQEEPLADFCLDVSDGNEPLIRALERSLPREKAAD
ncbi:MAG TPA: hypothetical protein VGL89_13615 [Candidatus Koribacter sp.]|jgi:hypothetical protein